MSRPASIFPALLWIWRKRLIRFSMDKFINELEDTLTKFETPEFFDISSAYSSVYHRFLFHGFIRPAGHPGSA